MISHLRKLSLIAGLGFLLAVPACSSRFVKSLSEMARLRKQLIEKYHEEDVNVTLNNSRFLSIVFVNSPLNQQDRSKRVLRAQETAKFALTNFRAGTIESIWVVFAAAETRWIFYHESRSIDVFVFDRNGEPPPDTPDSSTEDPLAPVAKYNSYRNETDVSITRIQLEGDLNHGIALVPHFTVSGNARRANSRITAPAVVIFDFASYSDRQIFSAVTKLEIRGDGQLIFAGDARLLSPEDSGSEVSIAQFLTAQIPFAQFVQMGNARVVKIKLGRKEFILAPEQIDALRRMAASINQTSR